MVLRLQKHKDNALDMRLVSMVDGKVQDILGYVWGWKQYNSHLFRATVTHSGTVYGRDCSSPKDACNFIIEKRKELGI
jgi:hypothetical protein